MKKLLITLLLLTTPLIGSATLVLPKTNPAAQQPAAKPAPAVVPAPVKPFVATVDEEEEDDETEALPTAAQTPTPAKSEQSTPLTASSASEKTTTTTPSDEKTVAPKAVQPVQPAMPEEDTLPLAVFNKTGRTIALYGKSEDDASPKLLTTLQADSAPAQIVSIPLGTVTVFVEDEARSNALSVEEGPQLITIAIASSVGTFTYTLSSITPQYGEHLTIYNATDNDQTVILQTTVTTPGIFSSTTTKPRYTFDVPAQTMQLVTIPQIALPSTQNKEIQCGLPNSTAPLTINSSDEAMFIITRDNGTPVIHKI